MTTIENTIAQLEQEILERTREFFCGKTVLDEAVLYAVGGRGKRLRPLLMSLVAKSCGADPKGLGAFYTALEWIHTYSLIHDDLPAMDDDDFRRGQPTVHKAYGEAVAILAGDALLNSAAELLFDACTRAREDSRRRALKISSLIMKKSGVQGMIGGQVKDVSLEKSPRHDDWRRRIAREKTGALFEAAVYAGVVWAEKEEYLEDWLFFARIFGEAYQVRDDLEDDEEERLGVSRDTLLEELRSLKEKMRQILEQLPFKTKGVLELVEALYS